MEKFIVITTCSDDLDVIKKVANILLEQKLVASCHITPIDSSYWWNDAIVHNREYKLEVRTRENYFQKISDIIRKHHNYEVPEISSYLIHHIDNKFSNWLEGTTTSNTNDNS